MRLRDEVQSYYGAPARVWTEVVIGAGAAGAAGAANKDAAPDQRKGEGGDGSDDGRGEQNLSEGTGTGKEPGAPGAARDARALAFIASADQHARLCEAQGGAKRFLQCWLACEKARQDGAQRVLRDEEPQLHDRREQHEALWLF